MAPPLRAPILYSQDGELPPATEDALEAMAPDRRRGGRQGAVIRVGDRAADAPRTSRRRDVAGERAAAIARADRPPRHRRGGRAVPGRDRRRPRATPPSPCPPPACRPRPARRCCGRTATTIPGADASTRSRPARSRASTSSARRRSSPRRPSRALEKLGPVERIAGDDPIANAIAVARYADGLVRLERRRPRPRPRLRRRRPAGRGGRRRRAVGQRQVRPAAARRRAGGPARGGRELPARHPAGYDEDPVRGVYNHAWLLGDEDGDLRRRPGAHRLAAGDPARRGRGSSPASWPKPSSPAARRPTTRVTVDDVRQLMGASTPHFALPAAQPHRQADPRPARRRPGAAPRRSRRSPASSASASRARRAASRATTARRRSAR